MFFFDYHNFVKSAYAKVILHSTLSADIFPTIWIALCIHVVYYIHMHYKEKTKQQQTHCHSLSIADDMLVADKHSGILFAWAQRIGTSLFAKYMIDDFCPFIFVFIYLVLCSNISLCMCIMFIII